MKRLPAWLRQIIAFSLVFLRREWGGVLYDYDNGRYSKLAEWDSDESMKAAWEIIQAGNGGRDFIYVSAAKTGNSRGYFMVDSSKITFYTCFFYGGIYEPDEALFNTAQYCRKLATELGFRNPEEKV
jgi:hypothetical protein